MKLYHPATDPPTFPVNPKPSEVSISGSILGRFCSFSTFFRQFFGVKNGQNRLENWLLLKGLLRVLGRAGEGVCGWKSGHKGREQKRHIRKNHRKFLRPPGWPAVPGTPGRPGVPGTPSGKNNPKDPDILKTVRV